MCRVTVYQVKKEVISCRIHFTRIATLLTGVNLSKIMSRKGRLQCCIYFSIKNDDINS